MPGIAAETLAEISDAVLVLNAAGQIEMINPAAAGLLGVGRRDALGRLWEELVRLRGEGGKRLEQGLEEARPAAARASTVTGGETPVLLTPHGEVPVEIEIHPVGRPGEMAHHLVVVLREGAAEPFSLSSSLWQTRVLHRVDEALGRPHGADALVKVLREELGADRAWIIHPCRPHGSVCQLLVESAEEEFPGAMLTRTPVPVDGRMQRVLTDALVAKRPRPYPRLTGVLSDEFLDTFTLQSQMMISVRPRSGTPWLLGVHQCARPRDWGREEQALLAMAARRLTRAIDSHLLRGMLRRPDSR